MQEIQIIHLNGEHCASIEAFAQIMMKIESQWHPDYLEDPTWLRRYEEKIYEKAYCFGVITDSQEVIGVSAVYANDFTSKQAYLTYIGLLEQYTHCGIGTELLNHTVLFSIEQGMKSMKLEVRKNNFRARSFYTKHNFLEIGDASETSLYMERHL